MFGGWFFKVILKRFARFLSLLPLLNVENIGILDMVLGFLWCLFWGASLYWNMFEIREVGFKRVGFRRSIKSGIY